MGATALPRWWLGRALLAVPVILGVTVLTFVLIHLAPGDPIYALAGDGGSPAYYADMRAKYGLDRPLPEQLVLYLRAVLTGDFGYSFMFQAPVASVIARHLPATLLLGTTALLIAAIAGGIVGFACGATPGGRSDRAVRVAASVAYSSPVFWTGQLLVILFAVQLGWLPVGGMTSARQSLSGSAWALDVGRHLVLPAVTLALPFLAVFVRVSRASLIEALQEPFVAAARARGLSYRRLVVRHAAPNAILPVAALLGLYAAEIAAGAALTESLFGWPGVGYLVLHASLHRDYPLVTGAFLVIAVSVVVVNALTDAVCAWLDPRIRLT